ncbi:helix-turn-helix transcriptional regulator [Sporosarcina saromensis]|uniref:Helix-turn-helix transcriptional regulator n=1 Tax=Sporosarcina saromensis TaxID=359365 RepID=A0ABU4G5K0_9BACL|nr:helix-turn-helix transcriptional regulator [Sporosarcina saromensis]MDW0112244.1 helix-turn-helix transcriptional regulator [Sporosarcina saromensis]
MFPDRLKRLRQNKKLSQQEMADFLGISRQGYGKYENGSSQPSFEMLEKLSIFFGVSTDYLLGTSENKAIVAGQEINLSEEEFILFNELKKHPIMLHDLATDPERKVKELIKLYKMKKMFLDDDEEEYGDGFGTLKD